VYNKILTVIETAGFLRSAADIWSDEERHTFIDWIAHHPETGTLIPDTGGLRKVRWGRAGMGKRGGVRVIYLVKWVRGEVWLLIAYTKARFDNLPVGMLRQWKDAIDG
jgi:hypothetical protein